MPTGIEWTDETWNPTVGCDRVSSGCDHCYALTLAKRLKAMGSADYQNDGDPATSGPGFGATMLPHRLDQPLRWTRPRRVFVNSMSDLFHEAFTDDYIAQVFAVMALAPQHQFQVLTKRHGRMRSLLNNTGFKATVWSAIEDLPVAVTGYTQNIIDMEWPLPNVWLGVSVEDQKWADIRILALLDTPAAVRFLSCEPLLGPIDLYRAFGLALDPSDPRDRSVDWVIVGGESGPGARPMHPTWARSLRDQCAGAGVPFLFKQHGEWLPGSSDKHVTAVVAHDGEHLIPPSRLWTERAHTDTENRRDWAYVHRVGKHKAGRLLDGVEHNGYPQERVTA